MSFTHDLNGNVTSDSVWDYTWDYRNRLVEATDGTSTVRYGYDHENNRIWAFNGIATTTYPNKYYNVDGATSTRHIFANDLLIATIEADGISTSTYYIHTDHLGGSSVITDQNGAIVELLDYYPFGDVRLDERYSDFQEQRQFTGHEKDQETGLNYMKARYQSGSVGRFMSIDPLFNDIGIGEERFADKYHTELTKILVDPQQLNSYTYVANNPLKNIDKSGEILDTIMDVGFIGYDLYSLGKAMFTGGDVKTETIALGADVAGAIMPFATGLGVGVRTARNVDRISDVARHTNWGRSDTLIRHASDHAKDFGLRSDDYAGYAQKANDFIKNADNAVRNGNKNYDSFVDKNGKTYFYDYKNSTFGVRNANGTTATAYKPKGGDTQKAKQYWNNQKKNNSKN